MSGRGRPASRPEPGEGHARPSPIDSTGLLVTHHDETGRRSRVYDFARLPAPARLQRELAEAFSRMFFPSGDWRSIGTSRDGWYKMRTFTTFLSKLESTPARLSELTPGCWAAWKISRHGTGGYGELRLLKTVLRDDQRVPAATRKLMQHRGRPVQAQETAFPPDEFHAMKSTAQRSVRAALQRIRQSRSHLETWRRGGFDHGSDDWHLGELLDELARTGHAPYSVKPNGKRYLSKQHLRLLGGDGRRPWQSLYLDHQEAISAQVLLVAVFGWNPTTVDELRVPVAYPDPGETGHQVYTVELEKRRRHQPHRYETRTVTDWGAASPGRLLTQIIEITEPAREVLAAVGAPSDRLLLWHPRKCLDVTDPASFIHTAESLVEHRLRWAQGHGLSLNLRRLRKTATAQHHREPVQHTQTVHDSVYALPDPQTRERAAPVISTGIAAAVEHARSTLVARIGDGTEDGQETATARCIDNTHSPFSPEGSPCRASFLSCLACPNAVIAPQHRPRLAYLHQVLDALRHTLEPQVWEHDWLQHFEHLTDLRDHGTAAEWNDARSEATAADRAIIEQLLHRGLDA